MPCVFIPALHPVIPPANTDFSELPIGKECDPMTQIDPSMGPSITLESQAIRRRDRMPTITSKELTTLKIARRHHHTVRRLAVKRLMRSGLIIEHQLAFQALMRSADRFVGMQIHLLVFDALPESFHKYVIPPAAFSVHADLDAVVFQ